MTNKNTPTDPAAMFQEWVSQWERATDKFSNQLMGTDEFGKYLSQMQNFQIEFQKTFADAMSRQLTNLNMPTREDVLSISEHLQSLERRMSRIESALTKLAGTNNGNPADSAAPPRTKKPVQAPDA